MADFIPFPPVKSDQKLCVVLSWMSKQSKSVMCKRLLPIINEFRNECLLDIESLMNLSQALQADNDLTKKPLPKAAAKNPITGSNVGFFSSNYKL